MSIKVNSLLEIASLFASHSEDTVIDFENEGGHNLDCLVNFIGATRLKTICLQPEVDIDFEALGKNPLSKTEVRKILISMLDLRIANYSTLLPEQRFPFKTRKELESLFLDTVPITHYPWIDKAQSSGKGFQGLAERVYLQSLHHLQIEKDVKNENETMQMLRDAEMLTSRIADREMQKGAILHLSKGYFYVDEVFVEGGAYIAALRDLDNNSRVKFVCRGTAAFRKIAASGGFLSGVNDLLIEIGTKGIKETWPLISKYLQHSKIQEVEILGKSLGGAHAQELTILVEGITKIPVRSLITYGSVGVDDQIKQLFNEVRAQTGQVMDIHVLRNGSENEKDIDFVPCVGGVHVGFETPYATTKVYYLNDNNKPSVAYSGSLGFFETVAALISSFSIAHCRQTTLKKFNWRIITDFAEVEQQLKMGLYLEKFRKGLAYIIHIFTFGLLNKESFGNYFLNEQNRQL